MPAHYLPELYIADADDVIDLAVATPGDVRTLVVVGHEPTTSVTALRLAGRRSDRRALEALADRFPTAAPRGSAVRRGHWADLRGGASPSRVVHRARG